MSRITAWTILAGCALPLLATAACAQEQSGPYAAWPSGPGASADYFPIGVWLQGPQNAARYRAAGINLYVGLWAGPTAEQLAELKAAGMPVFAEQNEVGLNDPNRDIIVGWMHGDEPDNAQPIEGGGYGPPVKPEVIIADYQRIKAADPSRPVLVNLGQGVAWDAWIGRGERTNHPEDYAEYVKGSDIASFDIYPVVHDHPDVKGNLSFVGRGTARLREWAGPQRPVWAVIECTHIGMPDVKPTPAQVRNEVWSAITHGAQGILYFSHQFAPTFIEAGMLADPDMTHAISVINAQLKALAPVINSPTIADAVSVASSQAGTPVDTMVKRVGNSTYVFAAAMGAATTQATFTVNGAQAAYAVVVGEDRVVPVNNGSFTDGFADYAAHIYRLDG